MDGSASMAATSRAAVGCCRQRQLCWQKAAVRLKMSGILASMLSIVLQVCLCTVSVLGMLTCRMQTLCHQLEAVELCKQRASTKQKQCDRAVAALHACQQRSRTCTGLHSVHVMFCSKRCWCVASRLQPSVPSPAWRVRLTVLRQFRGSAKFFAAATGRCCGLVCKGRVCILCVCE